MRRAPAALACALVVVAAASCALLTSLDGLTGGDAGFPDTGERASDAAPFEAGKIASDAGPDADAANVADAASDATEPVSDARAPCAQLNRGPVMVGAVGYCIDVTEVTQGQYAAFLAADAGLPRRPECSWKVKNTFPSCGGMSIYPVGGVDFCDADDYCRWAGKRLCGLNKGTLETEWYSACAIGAATTAYPYGNTFSVEICNGADAGIGHPETVASRPKCVGALPGLHDMSGNVWEWEDSCTAVDASADMVPCFVRGGSFQSTKKNLECFNPSSAVARKSTQCDLGIRCCSDR